MRIPEYLAVAQWAILLALGVLVVVMYRQLGVVLGGNRRPAAHGPVPGTPAPAIEYIGIGDGQRHVFTPGSDGQPALIAFVDPTCPACEELVESLGAARSARELPGIKVLLVTADPPRYIQISDAFMNTSLELGSLTSHLAREEYNVAATPLLVAIDAGGAVRAAGPARQRTEIHAYVRASLLKAPDTTLTVVAADSQTPQEPAAASPGQANGS
jgi:hypothetical protein